MSDNDHDADDFDPAKGKLYREISHLVPKSMTAHFHPDGDGDPHSSIRSVDRAHRMVVQLPAVSRRIPHHLRPQEVTFIMATSPITFHDSDVPFTATFNPVDAKGQPTTPDDIPQWSVSDATIIGVSSTTPDGLTATITIVGGEGTATLAVTTVDTNGTTVKASQDYTVVAGEAVSGTIETTPGIPAPTAAETAAQAAANAAPVDPTTPVTADATSPADPTATTPVDPTTPVTADATSPAPAASASVPSA